MADENKIFGVYEEIKDRTGKVHKIYSCKLKDLSTVVKFTTKYDPTHLQIQALMFWLDDKGEVKTDKDGSPMFMYQNPEFMDGIYEIIEMALDYREKRETIKEWLDFNLITEIVRIFLGLSQFKKKAK